MTPILRLLDGEFDLRHKEQHLDDTIAELNKVMKPIKIKKGSETSITLEFNSGETIEIQAHFDNLKELAVVYPVQFLTNGKIYNS